MRENGADFDRQWDDPVPGLGHTRNEMSNETPDDWGFHPTRREPRGEFPGHDDRPRPVLTLAQATHRAAHRLAEWIETHGYPPGGAR